jgi:peptidoglycan pentaglycine glycine transferase (the first glycine)
MQIGLGLPRSQSSLAMTKGYMENNLNNFIQFNSLDGGFLQSEEWKNFQEATGRKTYNISTSDNDGKLIAFANIIGHKLPVVGDYFYIPRGPIIENFKFQISNFKSKPNDKISKFIKDLVGLAKESNVGWIRIEPNGEGELEFTKNNLPKNINIKKSAVDMQSREILVLDISKSEEDILAQMKQKTRYNIRLAEKKEVKIFVSREEKYTEEFLRLVKITSERDKITSHPEKYYRKMFEIIPPEILKLYIAEYEGKVIAANLILFFGKTATYLHGASDNVHRNLMAPYLLQWQQIVDAKRAGCERYDFGGIKTQPHPNPLLIEERGNSWIGITKFKQGFAPEAKSVQFPGCYDIVLNPFKYNLYRILQKIRRIF